MRGRELARAFPVAGVRTAFGGALRRERGCAAIEPRRDARLLRDCPVAPRLPGCSAIAPRLRRAAASKSLTLRVVECASLRYGQAMPSPKTNAARAACALVCAAATWMAACQPAASRAPAGASAASAPAAAARAVRVQQVALEAWPRRLRALGDLEAQERATISAKVPGRIVELAFDLGTAVRRGEVIARIDPRDYELRLAQAEAAVHESRALLGLPAGSASDEVEPAAAALVRAAQAELDRAQLAFDRAQELEREGVASRAAFDTARAALSVAQAEHLEALEEIERRRASLAQRRTELAVARAQLEDCAILAPFDGLAGARVLGTGTYVEAGAALTELVCIDPLRARIEVPEREAGLVRVGQAVLLAVDGDAREHRGQIVRIAPTLDVRARSLIVEAEVPQPAGAAGVADATARLRPGSFARVDIVLDAHASALALPRSALVSFAGVERVFEYVEPAEGEMHARARGRRVELGRVDQQRVEILSGLEPGAFVVLEPGNLVDGAPLTRATGD
jgi:RND family efflux transporter MFP subunit